MPTVNQNVQFKAGLQSNYELLDVKDLNTLYFCTDTQRMFVGETEYSRPVNTSCISVRMELLGRL